MSDIACGRDEQLEALHEKLKIARENAHIQYLSKLAMKKVARKEKEAEKRKQRATSSSTKCSKALVANTSGVK